MQGIPRQPGPDCSLAGRMPGLHPLARPGRRAARRP